MIEGANSYRQNSQGIGVLNTSDLRVLVSSDEGGCPTTLTLEAPVTNHGATPAAAGVIVRFYEGDDATGIVLGEGATTLELLPGGFENIRLDLSSPPTTSTQFFVVVDPDDDVAECLETNNDGSVTAACLP